MDPGWQLGHLEAVTCSKYSVAPGLSHVTQRFILGCLQNMGTTVPERRLESCCIVDDPVWGRVLRARQTQP